MDPNQQYPNAPQGNPYDFILNPALPPKKKRLKDNFLATIILIIGGVFIIMVIAAIILNIVAPKKLSAEDLAGVAQSQTELIRVSQQATSGARQQSTRNLATTIQYTMLTQRRQTVDTLAKLGKTTNEKELALKQNATTDQRLRAARTTSTFDKTYTEIIEQELTTYANSLKKLSSISGISQKERDRMSDYYRQTQDLLSQIPYTQDEINSGRGTIQPAS